MRKHGLATKIIAVDAIGSVIFGGTPQPRLIPGHGASVQPQLFDPTMADQVILVSDLDCVIGCRRLLKYEAILAGGSSGAIIAALGKIWHLLPDKAACVVILCDRGERYLKTIYSDDWVREYFGDVMECWEDEAWV